MAQIVLTCRDREKRHEKPAAKRSPALQLSEDWRPQSSGDRWPVRDADRVGLFRTDELGL